MQWSVSRLVPTFYIAVSISNQPLHYFEVAFPVDVDGGVHGCQ